jgi:hypothetical protein
MLEAEIEAGRVNRNGCVVINTDEIRNFIPEYEDGIANVNINASTFSHDECREIAGEIEEEAKKRKLSIIKDGTLCNKEQTLELFNTFLKEGYDITLLGVIVDPKIAMNRATLRGFDVKRFVPADYYLYAHNGWGNAVGDYVGFLKENGARAIICDKSGQKTVELNNDTLIANAEPRVAFYTQKAEIVGGWMKKQTHPEENITFKDAPPRRFVESEPDTEFEARLKGRSVQFPDLKPFTPPPPADIAFL